MQGINDAVVRQIQSLKGGDELLPLWEQLWEAYQQQGLEGLDELIEILLEPTGKENTDD